MNSSHSPARPRLPARATPLLRLAPLLLAALLLEALLPAQAKAPAAGQPGVDAVRSALQRYVETRTLASKERQDWTVGKELLTDRIAVVQREIDSLRKKLGDAEGSITDADKKQAELAAENAALKQAAAGLQAAIGGFEARLQQLLPRLPEPVRDAVEPLSQRIPADPATTKLSLSDRFANVVGIVNAIDKFQGVITVTSEVRTLGNGTSAEVTTLYLGIAQGWYVTQKGDAAGVGSATADGWAWTPANAAAPQIRKAIAIFKNEQAASFVRLPLHAQ